MGKKKPKKKTAKPGPKRLTTRQEDRDLKATIIKLNRTSEIWVRRGAPRSTC